MSPEFIGVSAWDLNHKRGLASPSNYFDAALPQEERRAKQAGDPEPVRGLKAPRSTPGSPGSSKEMNPWLTDLRNTKPKACAQNALRTSVFDPCSELWYGGA